VPTPKSNCRPNIKYIKNFSMASNLDETLELFSQDVDEALSPQPLLTSTPSSTPQDRSQTTSEPCSGNMGTNRNNASMLQSDILQSFDKLIESDGTTCNNPCCSTCAKIPFIKQKIENTRKSQVIILCPLCKPSIVTIHKVIAQPCDKHKSK
jgi:hypothetical protein